MNKDYEMITIANYLNNEATVKCTTISEIEIEKEIKKYLLSESTKSESLIDFLAS